jgi:hypothetical protein
VIAKGSARGGPGDLAKHLQKEENAAVWIAGSNDIAARDIEGALEEMDALGTMLKTHRTLYHMSLNPQPGKDRAMTPEEWEHSCQHALKKMGLENQPYIIVGHVKVGQDGVEREHRHIVASVTDLENMRAIRMDHNYRKHEEISRDLERYLGHEKVQGAHAERFGLERPERTPTQAEMREAARGGIDSKEATRIVTELWRTTDNAQAMNAALEDAGWMLARGDKQRADGKPYLMLIDPQGGVHELRRRVEGVKAAEVYARMDGIDAANLPSIDQARAQQLDRQIVTLEAERNTGRGVERTEPPESMFDRDAAEGDWNERLIKAALAYESNRAPQANQAEVREFAGA